MNQQQTKYAREKISRIAADKRDAIYRKYKPGEMTPDEITQALKNGEFKVRDTPKNGWNNLQSYILFDAYVVDEENDKLMKAALKDLELTKSRMMDELILGDVQEALQILRDFEAKEF